MTSCAMCKREMGVETDPLSTDCGGDCWGCVGWIEFQMDPEYSYGVQGEISRGLRNEDGKPVDR